MHILLKTESGDFMLVTLSVRKGTYKGIFSFLKKDEILQEKVLAGDISLTNIYYSKFHKKINSKAILKTCMSLTDTVICKSGILPDSGKVQRFSDNTLNILLMENFILDILREFPPDTFRMVICDPLGEFHEFAESLSMYTTNLTIVTEMTNFYTNCCDEWQNPYKANLTITDKPEKAEECDLLIHPKMITSTPVIKSRLTFTAYPTKISDDRIIYRYIPEYPQKYDIQLPEDIDKNDFFCALYSLEKKYELGKLIPDKCLCSRGTVTRNYIMKNLFDK